VVFDHPKIYLIVIMSPLYFQNPNITGTLISAVSSYLWKYHWRTWARKYHWRKES